MPDYFENCVLCPRKCGINRHKEVGFCKGGSKLKIARAALHFWEEPPISGKKGSGAVFFSGCNLRCVFCQNYDISRENFGKEISEERLAEIFSQLYEKGANNINLVTPTHYIPNIVKAISLSKKHGVKIPFVYNSSGYESVESLKMLDGLIDIYLPDFKYFDDGLSLRYSHVKDYKEMAKLSLREMYRQVGCGDFGKSGIMKKGIIVRHLLLPNCLEDSKNIIKYLYDTYGNNIYISLMSQYTPFGNLEEYPELNRRVYKEEYDRLVNFAVELGVENGFLQDGEAADESFIPKFNLEGV